MVLCIGHTLRVITLLTTNPQYYYRRDGKKVGVKSDNYTQER